MWKKYLLGIGTCLLLIITGYQLSFLHRNRQKQEDRQPEADVSAGQQEDHVTKDTCIILESYDNAGTLTARLETVPEADMMGNNRLDMLIYAKKYQENASDEERREGLQRMVLKSFSPEQVVLAKYYGEPLKESGYILAVKDNAVIVYTQDRSQVYEYTNIELWTLPLDIQSELVEGIYVKNEQELFDFLQTYSS